MRILLKFLRKFSGAKSERYEFSTPGRMLPCAKILLGRAKLALRNQDGGLVSPPYLLSSDCIFTLFRKIHLQCIFPAYVQNRRTFVRRFFRWFGGPQSSDCQSAGGTLSPRGRFLRRNACVSGVKNRFLSVFAPEKSRRIFSKNRSSQLHRLK